MDLLFKLEVDSFNRKAGDQRILTNVIDDIHLTVFRLAALHLQIFKDTELVEFLQIALGFVGIERRVRNCRKLAQDGVRGNSGIPLNHNGSDTWNYGWIRSTRRH